MGLKTDRQIVSEVGVVLMKINRSPSEQCLAHVPFRAKT